MANFPDEIMRFSAEVTTEGNFNMAGRFLPYGFVHGNTDNDAITPSTTQTQAAATTLDTFWSYIATVANANDCVKIRADYSGLSAIVIVTNGGANILDIFPGVGHQIDALGANNAYSLAAGKTIVFRAISATAWVSISFV